MKKATPLLLASVLLAASGVVRAEDELDCEHISDSLTQNACWQRDYDASDVALNHAFKAAKKRITAVYQSDTALGTALQQEVLKAQRSWLQFRQQQCAVEAFESEKGSSANYTLTQTCMTAMNLERIKQLDNILKN